ncbi:unnamed protein product, partial [Adineta ricciae]
MNRSTEKENLRQPHHVNDDDIARRRENLRRAQQTIFIWLNSDQADFQQTTTQLDRIVDNANTFDDADECVDFITTITDNQVCLIIAESLAQPILPCIHELPQIHHIFVVGTSPTTDDKWIQQWSKVKGIFTDMTLLNETTTQTNRLSEQNNIPISFVEPDKKLNKLEPSFMYTQIMKEILLGINFGEQDLKEYSKYCCDTFADNPRMVNDVQQFERDYSLKSPIWWYTCENFVYPMLNQALRVMDGNIITRMGFFISDLHRSIELLHKRQYLDNSSHETFTVYRGQGLSQADFDHLVNVKHGLIAFHSFLSTTQRYEHAYIRAESNARNLGQVGVLFIMNIDPTQATTPFASIRAFSHFPDEDEILFSMHTVFRIDSINLLPETNPVFQVSLSLTTDNDPDLHKLTQHIRQNDYSHGPKRYQLAAVLIDIGQQGRAEDINQSLLGDASHPDETVNIMTQLGIIKAYKGNYPNALEYHEKALSIKTESLAPTHPSLAASYSNIGLVHYEIGNYSTALEYHEKALAIDTESLPPNHPSLAGSYRNIGLVHHAMGNYERALEYHEKALAIQAESLPSNHPSLASTYSNIGAVHHEMGNYERALEYHEKALALHAESLPANHPNFAPTYSNIGLVHHALGDYSTALGYHEKALALQAESLPPNHPSLARPYTNIGVVHHEMGNYERALEYHEKALAIHRKSLPPTHPSLAGSYTNIGMLHHEMGDYSTALEYHEKALALQAESLPPNHPSLARSYTNIGAVHHEMGNYQTALEYHEKALAIQADSLPPNHATLALSYSSIGAVHDAMGSYQTALEYHE